MNFYLQNICTNYYTIYDRYEIPNSLDKEQTSYRNVLDAFRLALKGIKMVKKRKLSQRNYCPS
jgi:hypothetical protein